MRGVWVASLGIDWPKVKGTSSTEIAAQKQQLLEIFNSHKSSGINAIFFHIRPKCDAVYKSSIEPWSRYLTGKDGLAPIDTAFDPLRFAIQEAHKRAMELHVWINPYRVNSSEDDPGVVSDMHVLKRHPEWVLKCSENEYRILNPGLPEVRAYLLYVIMDILRRYDIDGIHFDDYFYPSKSYGVYNDDSAFNKYKGNFTDRALWRKNNVNLLLSMINDSIKAVKPWVKFGISPMSSPASNENIYCDAFSWLKGNYTDTSGIIHSGKPYIDYILPQFYLVEYGGRLSYWSGESTLNGRHFYAGLGASYYEAENWTPYEPGWEIRTNRTTPTCQGQVFFSSHALTVKNYAGCTDSLKHNYFVYPAITPKMGWLPGGNKKPNAPGNLRFIKNPANDQYEFIWDKPSPTADGDTASIYVIYRFDHLPGLSDLENPANMAGYTGETSLPVTDLKLSATNGNYFAVTAFDRYSNESQMSNIFYIDMPGQVPAPAIPVYPEDNNKTQRTSAILIWVNDPLVQSYVLQVSKDSAFKQITANYLELKSNSAVVNGILHDQRYYWRVKACGIGGSSSYSSPFRFESGIAFFPLSP
ncbi:MAG: family 10 glycosylhydrolase [Bacillota bacterium]